MEVALEPPALVVGRLDDPRPRGAQLLDPRAQLDVEALVLEREAAAAATTVFSELGLCVERGVVADHRHRPPVDARPAVQCRAAQLAQLDRIAGGVDVAS